MEIVTWVLDGELEHKASEGHRGLLYPPRPHPTHERRDGHLALGNEPNPRPGPHEVLLKVQLAALNPADAF